MANFTPGMPNFATRVIVGSIKRICNVRARASSPTAQASYSSTHSSGKKSATARIPPTAPSAMDG